MKQDVLVRFANQSTYHTIISIDINKLQNITKFSDDVFATIDGVRISIKRSDYDELVKNTQKVPKEG